MTNFRKIIILSALLISAAYSYVYQGWRFFVYDSFGNFLGNNFIMTYELADVNVSENGVYTGKSDLYL